MRVDWLGNIATPFLLLVPRPCWIFWRAGQPLEPIEVVSTLWFFLLPYGLLGTLPVAFLLLHLSGQLGSGNAVLAGIVYFTGFAAFGSVLAGVNWMLFYRRTISPRV